MKFKNIHKFVEYIGGKNLGYYKENDTTLHNHNKFTFEKFIMNHNHISYISKAIDYDCYAIMKNNIDGSPTIYINYKWDFIENLLYKKYPELFRKYKIDKLFKY